MERMQRIKTPNSDMAIDDFSIIRDVLEDSSRYFLHRIEQKNENINSDDIKQLQLFYKRSTNALKLIDEIVERCSSVTKELKCEHLQNTSDAIEFSENTSYLDMSLRKYDGYELAKPLENPNDYVDVAGKTSKEFNDDDNIYDNYMVERNDGETKGMASVNHSAECADKNDISEKPDCPFNGLPAAHLTIMQSPKIGWLTMHLRGKRFIRHFSINFKRKYYTGLVSKQSETGYCEWWLLMYARGTSDLKPTVCLPLNQYKVHAEHMNDIKDDDKKECEMKRNLSKFELREKQENRKIAKSYCFVAETPEHCEHWMNLLKQLSRGLPYIQSAFITTAQIRKLPMLPLNTKSVDIARMADDIDTVYTKSMPAARSSAEREHILDICNYSEGVYEEPEDYYKNVQTTTAAAAKPTKTPILPAKKLSQSTASTIRMGDISLIYDTPKKPIRKTDDAKHYDLISVAQNDCNSESKLEDSLKRLKIDDEIRFKLSTQLKEQSNKYRSSSGQKMGDEENLRNSLTPIENATNKCHLKSVRKWLFSNHFSKLRQSSNSTNFGRTSSDDCTIEETLQTQLNQRHQTNAITPSSDVQKRTFSTQPKGSKVHMIINQLEANGQLTLLNGGTSSNKCIVSA